MQVISSHPNFKGPPLGSIRTGAQATIVHHDLSDVLESQRGCNDAAEYQRWTIWCNINFEFIAISYALGWDMDLRINRIQKSTFM